MEMKVVQNAYLKNNMIALRDHIKSCLQTNSPTQSEWNYKWFRQNAVIYEGGEQVIFDMTSFKLRFAFLLALAIPIKVADFIGKRNLIKEEVKKHMEQQ